MYILHIIRVARLFVCLCVEFHGKGYFLPFPFQFMMSQEWLCYCNCRFIKVSHVSLQEHLPVNTTIIHSANPRRKSLLFHWYGQKVTGSVIKGSAWGIKPAEAICASSTWSGEGWLKWVFERAENRMGENKRRRLWFRCSTSCVVMLDTQLLQHQTQTLNM